MVNVAIIVYFKHLSI